MTRRGLGWARGPSPLLLLVALLLVGAVTPLHAASVSEATVRERDVDIYDATHHVVHYGVRFDRPLLVPTAVVPCDAGPRVGAPAGVVNDAAEDGVTALTAGVPVHASVAHGAYAYFKFGITDGVSSPSVHVATRSGDPDLYMARAGVATRPSRAQHEWASLSVGPEHKTVCVHDPDFSLGTYYIGVYGYNASDFTITLEMHEVTATPAYSTCVGDEPHTCLTDTGTRVATVPADATHRYTVNVRGAATCRVVGFHTVGAVDLTVTRDADGTAILSDNDGDDTVLTTVCVAAGATERFTVGVAGEYGAAAYRLKVVTREDLIELTPLAAMEVIDAALLLSRATELRCDGTTYHCTHLGHDDCLVSWVAPPFAHPHPFTPATPLFSPNRVYGGFHSLHVQDADGALQGDKIDVMFLTKTLRQDSITGPGVADAATSCAVHFLGRLVDEDMNAIDHTVAVWTDELVPACTYDELEGAYRELRDLAISMQQLTAFVDIWESRLKMARLVWLDPFDACQQAATSLLEVRNLFNSVRQVACGEAVGTPAWAADPCCNLKLSFEQCCPRSVDTFASLVALDASSAEQLAESATCSNPVCSANVLGDYLKQRNSVGALATGCSARSASMVRDAQWDEQFDVYATCKQLLRHDAAHCQLDANCYGSMSTCDATTGRCSYAAEHAGEDLVDCLLARMDAVLRSELALHLTGDRAAPDAQLRAAFVAATEETQCTGPTGAQFRSRWRYQKVYPSCEDDCNDVVECEDAMCDIPRECTDADVLEGYVPCEREWRLVENDGTGCTDANVCNYEASFSQAQCGAHTGHFCGACDGGECTCVGGLAGCSDRSLTTEAACVGTPACAATHAASSFYTKRSCNGRTWYYSDEVATEAACTGADADAYAPCSSAPAGALYTRAQCAARWACLSQCEDGGTTHCVSLTGAVGVCVDDALGTGGACTAAGGAPDATAGVCVFGALTSQGACEGAGRTWQTCGALTADECARCEQHDVGCPLHQPLLTCFPSTCASTTACTADSHCTDVEYVFRDTVSGTVRSHVCMRAWDVSTGGEPYCGGGAAEQLTPMGCVVTAETTALGCTGRGGSHAWIARAHSRGECETPLGCYELSPIIPYDFASPKTGTDCSNTQNCNGVERAVFTWQANALRSGGEAPVGSWRARAWGARNRMETRVSVARVREVFATVVETRMAALYPPEAVCRYASAGAQIMRIACDCFHPTRADSFNCFTDIDLGPQADVLTLDVVCPGVNTLIIADPAEVELFGSSLASNAGCLPLQLVTTPASTMKSSKFTELTSDLFRLEAHKAYDVVENDDGVVVGQLVGNGIHTTLPGELAGDLALCVRLRESIEQDAEHTVYKFAVRKSAGSNELVVATDVDAFFRQPDRVCAYIRDAAVLNRELFPVKVVSDWETASDSTFNASQSARIYFVGVLYLITAMLAVWHFVWNYQKEWRGLVTSRNILSGLLLLFNIERGIYLMLVPSGIALEASVTSRYVLVELASFLYFSMYTLVLFLWIRIYQATSVRKMRNVPTTFILTNVFMYTLFVLFAILYHELPAKVDDEVTCADEDVSNEDDTKIVLSRVYQAFVAGIAFVVSMGIVVYGHKLVQVMRVMASVARMKAKVVRLRKISILAIVTHFGFTMHCIMLLVVLFSEATLPLDLVLWYLVMAEVIPSLVLLGATLAGDVSFGLSRMSGPTSASDSAVHTPSGGDGLEMVSRSPTSASPGVSPRSSTGADTALASDECSTPAGGERTTLDFGDGDELGDDVEVGGDTDTD